MNVFEHFSKKKDFLVCIDSDGCAMDTMDIKHIQCFGPCMVEEWGLDAWQVPILKRWNDINLYTMTRGINRFKGLLMALQEIDNAYCRIDDLASLERWVQTTAELSNASLEREAAHTQSPILNKALAWSLAVNQAITDMPDSFKQPFAGVRDALEAIHTFADVAIVSSANPEAVTEEWERYGLMEHVDIMLTQDMGSKAFCIGAMLKQGYDPEKVLMIGDAPGDRDAAQTNHVLYYPVLVRREEASWNRFREEAMERFRNQSYNGAYQDQLLKEFEANLS